MTLTHEQARALIFDSQPLRESGYPGKHRFHVGREGDMQDVKKAKGGRAWYMECVECGRAVVTCEGLGVGGSAVERGCER